MILPPPARSQNSILVRARGTGRIRTWRRVGAGVRVRVGFKDSVGVQSGQNFPLGTFSAHGASRAPGADGRLGAAPLATNCWLEAPKGGGGGGRGSWHPRTRGVAPSRDLVISCWTDCAECRDDRRCAAPTAELIWNAPEPQFCSASASSSQHAQPLKWGLKGPGGNHST